MAEYTALAPLFTDIANAIRSKTGETGAITANSFPEQINSLSMGVQMGMSSKQFSEFTRSSSFSTNFKANNLMCVMCIADDYGYAWQQYVLASLLFLNDNTKKGSLVYARSSMASAVPPDSLYTSVNVSFKVNEILITLNNVFFAGRNGNPSTYYCLYWV